MRKYYFVIFIILMVSGCSLSLETGELPDQRGAKEFSDVMSELFKGKKVDELYTRMDPEFRKAYSREILVEILEKVVAHFGEPLEFEYATDELYQWQYPNGNRKMARRLWYKAKTTTAEKGKYFLQVTSTKDNGIITCLNFSMLEFPEGVPENLR